ncbi:MAG: type II toxin-antitoxin system VapC family toxin, partial [Akkermansiaceae bacterium]|nr:type II toxin-antitoxin system VapC family toxin [Akkermansiaceae bacterium]
TTFLIDLQRERTAGDLAGPAHRFLAADPELELHLPVTALGEFAEGFEQPEDPLLRAIRELHVLLPIDEKTALIYGQITRSLRRAGRLIGTNDLWIAASSLRHELPLVTSNTTQFGRVDGLMIVAYR